MRGVNQIAATANNSLAAIRVVVAALLAPIVVVLKRRRLRKWTVIKMSLMTILSLILNQQKQ